MKTISNIKYARGYISMLTVISISMLMLVLTVFAYKRAINAHETFAKIHTQTDYREKEEAVMRSIVSIVPNRAILAMQHGSDANATSRAAVSFATIFQDALNQANARTSISAELLDEVSDGTVFRGNTGDSALANVSTIFKRAVGTGSGVSAGLNQDLGAKYPPALNFSGTLTYDSLYPIVSDYKKYGTLANGDVGLPTATYPDFNLIPYPQIDFGYVQPGEMFVAKRNWWAFRMNLAAHDDATTKLSRYDRTIVLSLYEIPSQLPISAGAYMALGQYTNGSAWQNITISGTVFGGRTIIEGATALDSVASRRGLDISTSATIGGKTFANDPFTPGVRETFQLTEGDFFPVSLASESGKAVFVPISRGNDFFDRYAHTTESNTVSPTTWNQYSVGAMQCAMRLDITRAASVTDRTPTELTFSYMRSGTRQTVVLPLTTGVATALPVGYIKACNENQSYTFSSPVDVAYGAAGSYYFREGVTGNVMFNNSNFGDPIVGTLKAGYYRPPFPFEIKSLPNGRICVAVYPERFSVFLALLGADSTAVNHSLAINVDYVNTNTLTKPFIPSTDVDYGVILQECGNLTAFTKGFSLVTNLPLHIGDDFNVTSMAPPAGYTPPGGAAFYPPCSLFAPEQRYGVNSNPLGIIFNGQVGSTARDDSTDPIRPLDTKTTSGVDMAASSISMNLSTISHPAELPPITMKNWLVVIEEIGREY